MPVDFTAPGIDGDDLAAFLVAFLFPLPGAGAGGEVHDVAVRAVGDRAGPVAGDVEFDMPGRLAGFRIPGLNARAWRRSLLAGSEGDDPLRHDRRRTFPDVTAADVRRPEGSTITQIETVKCAFHAAKGR